MQRPHNVDLWPWAAETLTFPLPPAVHLPLPLSINTPRKVKCKSHSWHSIFLCLFVLLIVARLQKPNYYVESTVFHRKRLLTLSRLLAVKTGKSLKDKREGKGMSVIPGSCPHHHHHHPTLTQIWYDSPGLCVCVCLWGVWAGLKVKGHQVSGVRWRRGVGQPGGPDITRAGVGGVSNIPANTHTQAHTHARTHAHTHTHTQYVPVCMH